MSKSISKETLHFLSKLAENNNRIWFEKNRSKFESAKEEMKQFLYQLKSQMNRFDEIESAKMFRIYRDIRFSKDKTPYKTYFAMSLSRQKPKLRGGYYLSISADSGFLGCGFWQPNAKDLAMIRSHIAQDDEALRKCISDPDFVRVFGNLEGDKVKTAPKGYSRDHPSIDLLRHKQFLVSKKYTLIDLESEGFLDQVVSDFKTIRPFFDYMSYILGHDLNGVAMY